MERIKIYNPDKLTKNMINDLIDKGVRFDIIADLDESDYSEPEVNEVRKNEHSRTITLY